MNNPAPFLPGVQGERAPMPDGEKTRAHETDPASIQSGQRFTYRPRDSVFKGNAAFCRRIACSCIIPRQKSFRKRKSRGSFLGKPGRNPEKAPGSGF